MDPPPWVHPGPASEIASALAYARAGPRIPPDVSHLEALVASAARVAATGCIAVYIEGVEAPQTLTAEQFARACTALADSGAAGSFARACMDERLLAMQPSFATAQLCVDRYVPLYPLTAEQQTRIGERALIHTNTAPSPSLLLLHRELQYLRDTPAAYTAAFADPESTGANDLLVQFTRARALRASWHAPCMAFDTRRAITGTNTQVSVLSADGMRCISARALLLDPVRTRIACMYTTGIRCCLTLASAPGPTECGALRAWMQQQDCDTLWSLLDGALGVYNSQSRTLRAYCATYYEAGATQAVTMARVVLLFAAMAGVIERREALQDWLGSRRLFVECMALLHSWVRMASANRADSVAQHKRTMRTDADRATRMRLVERTLGATESERVLAKHERTSTAMSAIARAKREREVAAARALAIAQGTADEPPPLPADAQWAQWTLLANVYGGAGGGGGNGTASTAADASWQAMAVTLDGDGDCESEHEDDTANEAAPEARVHQMFGWAALRSAEQEVASLYRPAWMRPGEADGSADAPLELGAGDTDDEEAEQVPIGTRRFERVAGAPPCAPAAVPRVAGPQKAASSSIVVLQERPVLSQFSAVARAVRGARQTFAYAAAMRHEAQLAHEKAVAAGRLEDRVGADLLGTCVAAVDALYARVSPSTDVAERCEWAMELCDVASITRAQICACADSAKALEQARWAVRDSAHAASARGRAARCILDETPIVAMDDALEAYWALMRIASRGCALPAIPVTLRAYAENVRDTEALGTGSPSA